MTSKPHQELRERVALCREQIEASPYSHTIAAGWYAEDVESLLEQLEATRRDLVDAVWDGQRQGFQAVREAISGRIAAPLVDEIMEDAEIIVRASNPASEPEGL